MLATGSFPTESPPGVGDAVPANPCILRHHRTFALLLDKIQSNEGLPGAKSAARSSPRSRFEPAVRTPRWACRSPPAAQGSEASPAARNTLDSARIPRASKLLICGLFQKGRVLAQDGGYTRIRGALSNLGHTVARSTIANILREHGIEPAPERGERTPWCTFLAAHWETVAATDFFTVEVATVRRLVTYYVLVVIELSSRKVHIAGITPGPDGPFMM